MTNEWGRYTLTVSKDGEVIIIKEYTGMSGTAMMDEAYSYRLEYPASDGYSVDW